jgi:hypothetical protein
METITKISFLKQSRKTELRRRWGMPVTCKSVVLSYFKGTMQIKTASGQDG